MGFFLKSVLCDAEDQVADTQEKGLSHLHKKVTIGKFIQLMSHHNVTTMDNSLTSYGGISSKE